MNCSCVYIDWDGDVIDINPTVKIRKARKNHICTECNREILTGEKYEYVSGKWGGDFMTFRTCLICREIRTTFFCQSWSYGDILNDLREHLWEIKGEISDSCLSEMSKPARNKVCDMIENIWKEI
ncbi:MAG: hypothetical protein PHI16_01555 [Methanocellales archaeon]|nr:hypothetical protein [Methanocellales archaeon]